MLICLSQAIEPIGGYTTESVTHGQCDTRPTVTFPANGRYQFILLDEQRHIVCEQLAQSRYVKQSSRGSNLQPLGCKSDAVTTTPHPASMAKYNTNLIFDTGHVRRGNVEVGDCSSQIHHSQAATDCK